MNEGIVPFINVVQFAGLGVLSLFLVVIVGMLVLERFLGPKRCDDCKKEIESPRYNQ